MGDPASLQYIDCLDWSRRYPISTRTCLNQFHQFTSFQLGYICSLAAVPFGRGSRGASFTNRQKIAQAAWVLIAIALFLGLLRRRAFRYTQHSTSQIIWEPLAFCSKLLAIAFAPLFGILVGDLDPNSNLLEVLVWILPGLLFHRYSPEIIEENSLTGMLINTVTYIPGLLTAAFSIWSAGDFSLLAPVEVWTSKQYLYHHRASLAVRVLATVTIGIAFLRQTFGAYTNLVLATKRQQVDWQLGQVNEHERFVGANNRAERQEEHDRIMQTLYNTNGLPRLSVDLDRHSLKNHAVLVIAEVLTFVPIGLFVTWTTNLVKGLSFCAQQSPSVPSYFSLQAIACRPKDFNCQKVAESAPGSTLLDARFCDAPSFNVALFTGYFTVVFTLASFVWVFVQVWAVHKNHTDDRRPACKERPPQAIREEFSHQVKHLLGTYYSRTGLGAYFLLPFLLISIWRQPRSFRTGANHVAEEPVEGAEHADAVLELGIVNGHPDTDKITELEEVEIELEERVVRGT